MKLIACLVTITATGVAAWMFLKKRPARALLRSAKARKSRSVQPQTHPVHHKRNGMTTHAAH